jgi:phosphatidylglycerophosphatase A
VNGRNFRERLILFLAEGFGAGRIPIVPGTFGTMIGFGWLALLVWSGSLWVYAVGTVAGFLGSVWIGGEAEKILRLRDPNRIVIDEIIAIPIAYLAIYLYPFCTNRPVPVSLWLGCAVVFVLFRVLDIWKPWPVRQSQNFPGGWGLTIDDALAALYVDLVVLVWLLVK